MKKNKKYNFNFFKKLLECPFESEFMTNLGYTIDVRKKIKLILKDNREFFVFLHSSYFNSLKNEGLNEIGFILENTRRLEVLSIAKINKIVKEIIY